MEAEIKRYNYVIFSAQYLPHMGGVENYTSNLARELIKKNCMVTVVTSNNENLNYSDLVDDVIIYRLSSYNLLDGRFPIYKKDKVFNDVFCELKKQKFDLCIVNTRFYFHSLLGVKYAKENQIPCILIDHGTSHLTVHNKFLDVCGGIFEHMITSIEKRYCKHYYAVSKASSKWLGHFGIRSEGELYNAIDFNKIQELRQNQKLHYRTEYNIPENAIVVTFTGRLLKEKGIVQLINSVKKLNQMYNDLYLIIAGDGPELDFVNENLSRNIIALGRIQFEEIICLLTESDIFCLPSDSEGFSSSLLEAAACNTYIIATDVGGARELILDESYGMLIENNEPDLLQKALEDAYLMSNREDSTEKVYQLVKNNYTWEVTADRIWNMTENIS